MTEQLFADTMKKPVGFDYFAPENIALQVVGLGSQVAGTVNGQIFEVGKLSIADGWRKDPEVEEVG